MFSNLLDLSCESRAIGSFRARKYVETVGVGPPVVGAPLHPFTGFVQRSVSPGMFIPGFVPPPIGPPLMGPNFSGPPSTFNKFSAPYLSANNLFCPPNIGNNSRGPYLMSIM